MAEGKKMSNGERQLSPEDQKILEDKVNKFLAELVKLQEKYKLEIVPEIVSFRINVQPRPNFFNKHKSRIYKPFSKEE